MALRSTEDLFWQPSIGGDIRRYAVAAVVVLALCAGAMRWVGGQTNETLSSNADDAVLVDLAPMAAASPAQQTAPDGAGQPQVDATPPAPPPKPDDPMPKLVPLPEPTPIAVPPPPTPPAAVAPPQSATAPPGAAHADARVVPLDEEEARQHAAHAISGWQRAMMGRLEAAKHGLRSAGAHGRADIAFSIDRAGALVDAHLARSSGSERLDRMALSLVRRAAPFPAPPAPLTEADLSFTVPVVFADRP